MVRRAWLWPLAVAIVAPMGWVAAAAAQDGPCAPVDRDAVGRLLGPTATPEEIEVRGADACRVVVDGSLTLDVVDVGGGTTGFEAWSDAGPAGTRQAVDDYVDGAAFAWSGDEVRFVARRGEQVLALRLTGESSRLDFDSVDPLAGGAGDELAGSQVGSALWALMTDVFTRTEGTTSPPAADDLDGLWRTTDLTPCPPLRDLSVRVSRIEDADGELTATKVTGDACLADGEVDFSGTVDGGRGEGESFGGTGVAGQAAGTPYQLTVRSATQIRLTGQAGSLRYTLDYQRLSWPGLSEVRTSALLGLPSPSESLTAKNVVLSGAVSSLLLLLVVLPTTLFNSALEANLERYRAALRRLRARLSRGGGEPGTAARSSPWQSPAGLLGYLGLAGFVYSLMQPGWGWNSATLVSLLGFIGAVAVSSAIGVVASMVYLGFRYRDGRGKPVVAPSTLGIAALCVLASRAVGFVPGYMYGVLVGWDPRHERDDFDRGRIVAFGSTLTLVLAIVAWLLIPVCRRIDDGGVLTSVPLAVVGGVFVGCTESLMIGLLPVHLLPGDELRRHSKRVWQLLWAAGGFLFVLVLLRPGLVTGSSQNVWGTLILVAVGSVIGLGFWALQRPPSPPFSSADAVTVAPDQPGEPGV